MHRVTPLGRPGPELVSIAGRDGDLLVVGRGHHLRWRPSVSAYCVRHARCPVLVVPPDPFADALAHRGTARLHRGEFTDLLDRYGDASRRAAGRPPSGR